MRIIPAIDIIEGKCVRLSQGDYSKKTIYNSSPFEMAQRFEDHGINYLHLVDLDGAKSSKIINHKILEQIALKTVLNVDFDNFQIKKAIESVVSFPRDKSFNFGRGNSARKFIEVVSSENVQSLSPQKFFVDF